MNLVLPILIILNQGELIPDTVNKVDSLEEKPQRQIETSYKLYEISPYVGNTIDKNENEFYKVFDIKDFVEAQVIKGKEEYLLTIKHEKGNLEIQTVNDTYLDSLKREIEEKGQMSYEAKNLVKDPNTTRLFIMPTGQTLKQGKSYFADYELFMLWYSRGVTDQLMFSLGVTAFPTPEAWLVYFGPKVKIFEPKEGHSFSLGAHIFTLPFISYNYGSSLPLWGAFYGAYTVEKGSGCITLGAGTSTIPSFDVQGAFIGIREGVGKVKFLAEYWHLLYKETDYYDGGTQYSQVPNLIIGMRFTGQNMSADLGLFYPDMPAYLQSFIIGLPVVNFVYNF